MDELRPLLNSCDEFAIVYILKPVTVCKVSALNTSLDNSTFEYLVFFGDVLQHQNCFKILFIISQHHCMSVVIIESGYSGWISLISSRSFSNFLIASYTLLIIVANKAARGTTILNDEQLANLWNVPVPEAVEGNIERRSSMDKENLGSHAAVQIRERPYFCTICEKRFTRPSHLKIHMRIHTSEKPFSCSGLYNCTICGNSFYQSFHLKRHMNNHIGEKHIV
ncbi:hypothetical protein DINM_004106 [Dirofilaria immitis]|nr:hypothetical protein [Dirofilaria immitis]